MWKFEIYFLSVPQMLSIVKYWLRIQLGKICWCPVENICFKYSLPLQILRLFNPNHWKKNFLDNTLRIEVTFNLNVSNDMAIGRWVWSFFPLEDVNLCLFGSELHLWTSGLKCCMNLRRVNPFRTSYGSLFESDLKEVSSVSGAVF